MLSGELRGLRISLVAGQRKGPDKLAVFFPTL
jgi:hypothetical protein